MCLRHVRVIAPYSTSMLHMRAIACEKTPARDRRCRPAGEGIVGAGDTSVRGILEVEVDEVDVRARAVPGDLEEIDDAREA